MFTSVAMFYFTQLSLQLFRYRRADGYYDAGEELVGEEKNTWKRTANFYHWCSWTIWGTAMVSQMLAWNLVIPSYVNVFIWVVGVGVVRLFVTGLSGVIFNGIQRKAYQMTTGARYSYVENAYGEAIVDAVRLEMVETLIKESSMTLTLAIFSKDWLRAQFFLLKRDKRKAL